MFRVKSHYDILQEFIQVLKKDDSLENVRAVAFVGATLYQYHFLHNFGNNVFRTGKSISLFCFLI